MGIIDRSARRCSGRGRAPGFLLYKGLAIVPSRHGPHFSATSRSSRRLNSEADEALINVMKTDPK